MQEGGTGLYAVNLTTGNATFVTNFSTSIIGDIETAAAPLVSSVPEPSSLALFGTGLLAHVGMGFTRLRTGSASTDQNNQAISICSWTRPIFCLGRS